MPLLMLTEPTAEFFCARKDCEWVYVQWITAQPGLSKSTGLKMEQTRFAKGPLQPLSAAE